MFLHRINTIGKRLLIRAKDLFLYRWSIIKRIFRKPVFPKNPEGKVYVNVGSGKYSGGEFINIDTQPLDNIHYVADIKDLKMFSNDSVDLLYACHVVEHIPRSRLTGVLKEWRRVLKVGGILRISIPDFDKLLKVYVTSPGNVESIVNQLMGQDPPYDAHFSIWNWEYATRILGASGFGNFRRWNPDNAPHHGFKDKSARKMKAGKDEIFISLNIEVDKL